LYTIRIKGRLGATALSAFPSMVSELEGCETVLTGLLEDQSAVFGVVARAPTDPGDATGITTIRRGQLTWVGATLTLIR
jgi:hypothetical protein